MLVVAQVPEQCVGGTLQAAQVERMRSVEKATATTTMCGDKATEEFVGCISEILKMEYV
jgi:hypothetical protein